MSRGTLLFLALTVSLLGYATWRQVRLEDHQKKSEDVALFEGVDPARVKRLLVENLERDQHLAFERDELGRWLMTEPMRIRADQATVQRLFEVLLDRHGTPISSTEADPKALHLDPPRAILEMEVVSDGAPRRVRVDLGSIDLDGAHVHVSAGGRLLRTWRDIDTMLDRTLEDYMSHAIVELPPQEVVEIHRRGSLARSGEKEPFDLTFDALLEEGSWRATTPVAAPLDPDAAGVFVQTFTSLRAARFADFGHRLLGDFGLDPPEMTVRASTVGAKSVEVQFGRPGHVPGGAWHCTIPGQSTVWIVDAAPVDLFDSAVEILLDPNLTRFPVQEIDALTLGLEGRELRLWKEKIAFPASTAWRVSERAGPETAYTKGIPADARKVEDLLARASHVQIASFLHGETLEKPEIRGSIVMQAGGVQQGGSFGREVGTAEKGRAVRCQRAGDSIAGLVDPAVLELLRTPMSELQSLLVVDLPEIEQTALAIRGAGVQKRYVHGSKGLWTPPDVAIEARELHEVLDTLMILRATRHLTEGVLPPLVNPVEIEVQSLGGAKTTYSIGIAPDGTEGEKVQVDREGRRSVVKDQAVHARLMKILKS